MPSLRTIGGHIAGLAWVAVKSFVGTLLVLTFAGFILAAIAYYFLADSFWWGIVVAVIAVCEGIATGIFFGSKRAIIMTLAHGLAKLRLGRSAVQLVFNRLLNVAEEEAVGARGGQLAQIVERLPLAQAEKKLTDAVQAVVNAPPDGSGWFRRKVQGMLLNRVHKFTLARFREEGAAHGGVDVLKVRTELEDRVDDILVHKLRSGLNLWTIGIIIGLPLVVAVETALVYFLILASK